MTSSAQLPIDTDEVFPVLSHAPIVEAVVEFRSRPTRPMNEESVRQFLTKRLTDYSDIRSLGLLQMEWSAELGQRQQNRWEGFRLKSSDGLHIAQFKVDRLIFSRLAPYANWQSYRDEALRLWALFVELNAPTEIERIGVRFVNRIVLDAEGYEGYSAVLSAPPQPTSGVPLTVAEFVYRDNLEVPGHSYGLNRIRTIQPPQSPDKPTALILDIDVFTKLPCDCDAATIENKLAQMRWLKNKVFFGTLTTKALDSFK
jgi:uncharacterized protein (TIGR04255 family)